MDRFPPRLWLIEYPSGVRNFWYREPDGVERLNVTTIGQMISLQEHEALLQEERARSDRLLEALKKYKNMSCSVQNIDMAARDAIAAHEKSQAGGG